MGKVLCKLAISIDNSIIRKYISAIGKGYNVLVLKDVSGNSVTYQSNIQSLGLYIYIVISQCLY